MPSTAKLYKTSVDALRAMTAEDQLDYVEKYFSNFKGKLHTLEDVYLAIFYPDDIGMDKDSVMFTFDMKEYQQNKGFDKTHSGKITVQDVSATVRRQLEIGLSPAYFG